MGRHDYKNCVAFNSLSKALQPAWVCGQATPAGDAELIRAFLLYRTYHGSAMSVHPQRVSVSRPGSDEQHVIEQSRKLSAEVCRRGRDTARTSGP